MAAPSASSLEARTISTLRSMSARVGDIRKLREDESQFGEETEHLACHRLNVVLPANDDESRDLVTN